jgi:hypothetical protein
VSLFSLSFSFVFSLQCSSSSPFLPSHQPRTDYFSLSSSSPPFLLSSLTFLPHPPLARRPDPDSVTSPLQRINASSLLARKRKPLLLLGKVVKTERKRLRFLRRWRMRRWLGLLRCVLPPASVFFLSHSFRTSTLPYSASYHFADFSLIPLRSPHLGSQESLRTSPHSLVAHLLAASFFRFSKDWESLSQVAEAGIRTSFSSLTFPSGAIRD